MRSDNDDNVNPNKDVTVDISGTTLYGSTTPVRASMTTDHDEIPASSSYQLQDGTTAAAATTTTTATQPPPQQYSSSAMHDDEFRDEDDMDDGEEGNGGAYDMSLTELMYSASSYHAIAKPVSFTMILAALSVVTFNTEYSIQEGEREMAAAYTVWKIDDGSEGGQHKGSTLMKSVGNSLVIVTVICCMTFGIVLLYKFRFMKCLIGYMVLSSATLLGVLGGVMFEVAIEKYRIPIDKFTFYVALYNFAIVGVIAIFFQTGIPTRITQAYLVATSVILAWQLSHFDAWTAWTLLIALALYDLCAVLTPCGPLKALVHLMSQDDSPDMPGLLYEAELPAHARRPGNGSARSNGGGSSRRTSRGDSNVSGQRDNDESAPQQMGNMDTQGISTAGTYHESNSGTVPPVISSEAAASPAASRTSSEAESPSVNLGNVEMSPSSMKDGPSIPIPPAGSGDLGRDRTSENPTAIIPLAIAKLYKLPLVSPLPHITPRRTRTSNESNVSTSPLLDDGGGVSGCPPSPDIVEARNYTPAELRADVEVRLPRNGGRIDKTCGRDGTTRYVVKDRTGVVKRTLLVNRQGKVFEELDGDDDSDDGHGGRMGNSIRLGLGDFIFYSVLVAKAAQYSFATFAACMLVILAGLGGTLVLLAVYHHALPALPISIFLGVVFYLATRLSIEPWIEDLLRTPFYV